MRIMAMFVEVSLYRSRVDDDRVWDQQVNDDGSLLQE